MFFVDGCNQVSLIKDNKQEHDYQLLYQRCVTTTIYHRFETKVCLYCFDIVHHFESVNPCITLVQLGPSHLLFLTFTIPLRRCWAQNRTPEPLYLRETTQTTILFPPEDLKINQSQRKRGTITDCMKFLGSIMVQHELLQQQMDDLSVQQSPHSDNQFSTQGRLWTLVRLEMLQLFIYIGMIYLI